MEALTQLVNWLSLSCEEKGRREDMLRETGKTRERGSVKRSLVFPILLFFFYFFALITEEGFLTGRRWG